MVPMMRSDPPVYYETKRIRKMTGGNLILSIPKDYFEVGDRIHVMLWKIDRPDDKIIVTRRVASRGGGAKCFYVDKTWGFEAGDLIVFRMRLAGSKADMEVPPAEEDDDS